MVAGVILGPPGTQYSGIKLPIGWFYATYHHLEPEKSFELRWTSPKMVQAKGCWRQSVEDLQQNMVSPDEHDECMYTTIAPENGWLEY